MSYSMPCANTAALNAYLAQMDIEDRREYAIDARAQELLERGEFNSRESANVAEAVAEAMYGKNAEVLINAMLRCMGNQITDKDALSLSMVLSGAVKAYWYEAARAQAKAEIDGATCRHCYDEGCKACDPDYEDF